MKNKHSSDGIAEDMIRAFVQTGCAETHAKMLLEKYHAQLESGLTDDANITIEKMNASVDEVNSLAELRRRIMLALFNMYDGDKDYWCMVKHLGIGAYTLFEAYQASDDDAELLSLAIDANKAFITALSHFLGTEITDCAACFADMLKGETK